MRDVIDFSFLLYIERTLSFSKYMSVRLCGHRDVCRIPKNSSCLNIFIDEVYHSMHSASITFDTIVPSKRKNQQVYRRVFVTSQYSLIVILFLICRYSIVTNAHSCSYQVPDTGDLILNVPFMLDTGESLTHSYNKHYADVITKHGHVQHAWKRRVRRDHVLGREFEPLRIALHFDASSVNVLPIEKQLYINSSLLPQATNFWEKALLVRPSKAPIRLSRKCKSNHYYLDASDPRPTCVERCRSDTKCGEVVIPDNHLFQCRFCARDLPNPLTCKFSGPTDGPGITGADFLLYVSAVNSTRCENADTIAYAAHCQQEAELDRPIAGHVNICPSALSTHVHDQEILLSTIKHEILHALGFSAGLYAFFRYPDGRPRTKRNRHNRPIIFNKERGYYDADKSTIQTVIRHDWWTAEGTISHPVHLMVTERVTDEARKHFACDLLEGAELENQGGDGTAFTHWEKRLFENEAMTGTHTQNPVYSRLTLALMEDSGWYMANYTVVEHLHWGNGLGCNFAMKSCGEWIKTRLEKNMTSAPFCHHIKHDGRKSLATTRCTDQRDSLALCNLIPYKKALPIEFRNFVGLQAVRKEGVKYYGGSVELADYCPYNQEFEWKSINSTENRRDSRCELRSNAPPLISNSVMEVYGNNSRCFDLASTWTERKCGRLKSYTQFMAGCYHFACKDGRVNIRIDGSSYFYPCYYAGQSIYIRKIINGWLREGIIQCPSCEEICGESQFWHFVNTKHNTHDTEFSVKDGIEEANVDILKRPLENVEANDEEAREILLASTDLFNEVSMPATIVYAATSSTTQILLPKSPLRYGIKERREIAEPTTETTISGINMHAKCAPDLRPEELYNEIGDPPLDEPCNAFTPILNMLQNKNFSALSAEEERASQNSSNNHENQIHPVLASSNIHQEESTREARNSTTNEREFVQQAGNSISGEHVTLASNAQPTGTAPINASAIMSPFLTTSTYADNIMVPPGFVPYYYVPCSMSHEDAQRQQQPISPPPSYFHITQQQQHSSFEGAEAFKESNAGNAVTMAVNNSANTTATSATTHRNGQIPPIYSPFYAQTPNPSFIAPPYFYAPTVNNSEFINGNDPNVSAHHHHYHRHHPQGVRLLDYQNQYYRNQNGGEYVLRSIRGPNGGGFPLKKLNTLISGV